MLFDFDKNLQFYKIQKNRKDFSKNFTVQYVFEIQINPIFRIISMLESINSHGQVC